MAASFAITVNQKYNDDYNTIEAQLVPWVKAINGGRCKCTSGLAPVGAKVQRFGNKEWTWEKADWKHSAMV
jgi:hypothetical protein